MPVSTRDPCLTVNSELVTCASAFVKYKWGTNERQRRKPESPWCLDFSSSRREKVEDTTRYPNAKAVADTASWAAGLLIVHQSHCHCVSTNQTHRCSSAMDYTCFYSWCFLYHHTSLTLHCYWFACFTSWYQQSTSHLQLHQVSNFKID